ncbi:glycoside hydrolase family 13 protein [Emticicia sp. 21SJ11W-3]|uniref:glycoside hydrolase family 13 protein n=1 Tax=Emticicia sp. 21SJ11W-3 TaxID=2916755 RepID=UPI0020A00F54|nr:glycoside hydrolase family 13 protein [Emticicia sp. 21SJ11W-3]UTA70264.1 glycoside hydrolase family 13 protein [Emticicia sp. 21SJ11W-3]
MKSVLKPIILIFIQWLLFYSVYAQKPEIQRINPTNWWVGMKNPQVQLLIYGKNIAGHSVTLQPYAGVKITKTHKVENTNYLFVDLLIAPQTKPGNLTFRIGSGANTSRINYELKKRTARPQTITQADAIYLLMPDRFSNGDESNDKFADMIDTSANRKNPWLRHGGDLQGVINHLDYFKELGVTTLWLTPVVENNQPVTNEGGSMRSAYHGYGFTDHYHVDKRLGGNETYLQMIEAAHKKGLKIVQDAVYNHVGINHWFLKDIPAKDWLNQWDTYTNTSYKDQPIFDIHGSVYDKSVTSNGWFVPFLPDLNQRNPYVANFLIQHALWTIEYFNIDGWRIDTYIYNDLHFMNRCNKAILDEHPDMLLFGESAVGTVVSQAYFTKNNFNIPFKCNLPSSCDFQVQNAINTALNERFGWNEGVNRLYQVLAQDLVYQNPERLVPFVENHDSDRFFSIIGEDLNKYKMGLTWLYTIRGIPQLYYGTEILMKNFKNPTDAEVRRDFPGGWKDDTENKFLASGRSPKENEAFEWNKRLLNYRKNSAALTLGKMMQFLPVDGVYVYFRYTDSQKVMVISNTNAAEKELKTRPFAEILKTGSSARNVMTDEILTDLTSIKIAPMTALVLEINH